jgi:hypothetical protein
MILNHEKWTENNKKQNGSMDALFRDLEVEGGPLVHRCAELWGRPHEVSSVMMTAELMLHKLSASLRSLIGCFSGYKGSPFLSSRMHSRDRKAAVMS